MSVEPKVFEHVRAVLNGFDGKYLNNGKLKRNKIIEDLDAYDEQLMTTLLSDPLIHKTYTKKLAGVEIFEVNQFIQMLEFKDYWEDSYTKYSNKIGLTAGGKFIDESEDVVLDFPFKDTVLKAGMTKEDTKENNEPFLNEIIAKPEIDELLEPKVFVNAKRYDADGEHEADSFTDTDNLVIKGNNLIALHSIKNRYAKQVKVIYLDPPYNTGKDDFSYNDSFTRSAWLTFMKNRLEIARDLLADDGVIFVNIDTSRANSARIQGSTMEPYLHILMDEIFGTANYLGVLSWKKKQPSYLSRLAGVLDHIFVYAKNEKNIKKLYGENTSDNTKRIDNVSNPVSERLVPAGIRYMGAEENLTIKAGTYTNKTMSVEYESDVVVERGRTKNEVVIKARWRTTQENITDYCKQDLLYINRAKTLRRFVTPEEEGKKKSITDLLLDWGQNQDATKELNELFGKKVFETPKPERLLFNLIKSNSSEGDLVMDFFMGSATTQAVAMKMNRQFIGIEQMDYINTISVPRLQKVIEGEQGGISKDVKWQGGGSFVYAELMEKNGGFVRDVEKAANTTELLAVFDRMKNIADFGFQIDLDKFKAELNTFDSLVDQKRELLRILDKNQLYYNHANIDDANVRDLIADHDYKFNQSFYRNGGED